MRATRCLGDLGVLVEQGFGSEVLVELLHGGSVSGKLAAVFGSVEGFVAVDERVGGVECVVHVHADDLFELGSELVVRVQVRVVQVQVSPRELRLRSERADVARPGRELRAVGLVHPDDFGRPV